MAVHHGSVPLVLELPVMKVLLNKSKVRLNAAPKSASWLSIS